MTPEGSKPTSSPAGDPSPGPPDELEAALAEELAPELHVMRCVGRGSMAAVYLAREAQLKRLVAIKVLAPRLAEDDRARQRFEREAQAVASLPHPSIVSVYRVGRLSSGLPYIVMRYVKGTNLADRLKATGALPIDEAQRILQEVASAIAAAHKKGIVHRDIRPANIMYEEESGKALLTDSGIAAILAKGAEDQPARLTMTGELVGNPAYMSPEQLLGEEVTERSDVYGLGLLGYELIAGRGPYDGVSNREMFAAHLREQPRKLKELRPEVSPVLADLIERCLAKEPEHRPSASDVANRLAAMSTLVDSGPHEIPMEAKGLFGMLTERRLIQIVGTYAAGGFVFLELVDQLEGRNLVPELSYQLALITYLFGLPVVILLAWFHGKKGHQGFKRVEPWLFGGLGALWFGALVIAVLRWASGG